MSESTTSKADKPRGRDAQTPWQIPWRGWREALKRAFLQIGKDNIPIVGAGVAFYAFLSLFPLIIATISLYGLVASPEDVTEQLSAFSDALPAEAHTLIQEQMQRLATQTDDSLGWGVALGVLIAVWSSSRAVKNMMVALNIAYNESEGRNIFKQAVRGLWLTFLIIVALIIALAFIVVVPPLLSKLPIGEVGRQLVATVRWPVLLILAVVIIGMLYRWGPNRANARIVWLSPGALFAAITWIVASWAFSFFVSRFGNYDETYGSVAAVIILLLWFMISATVVLIGAEINGELERQTREDTTTGNPKPLGQRGAYVADTVGGEDKEKDASDRKRDRDAKRPSAKDKTARTPERDSTESAANRI